MLAFPLSLVRAALFFLGTRLLAVFGLGIVSYRAVSAAIGWIEAELHHILSSSFPPLFLNLMGLLGLDICINLIFSALTGVIAFRAMSIMLGRS